MITFMRKREKGFTLIEVMLVVIIIGIIAIIALPKLLVTRDTARNSSCDSNLQALRTAIEQYNWEMGLFPDAATGPDSGVGLLVTQLQTLVPAVAPDTETYGPWLPADSSISALCPDPDGVLTYDPATGSLTCAPHT